MTICDAHGSVIDVLTDRVLRAVKETGVRQVALAGGVAANAGLRAHLAERPEFDLFLPPRHRCTDNAAMIAFAGRERLVAGQLHDLGMRARPRWQPGTP